MSKAKQNFCFSVLSLGTLTSTAASHFERHQIRELCWFAKENKNKTRKKKQKQKQNDPPTSLPPKKTPKQHTEKWDYWCRSSCCRKKPLCNSLQNFQGVSNRDGKAQMPLACSYREQSQGAATWRKGAGSGPKRTTENHPGNSGENWEMNIPNCKTIFSLTGIKMCFTGS